MDFFLGFYPDKESTQKIKKVVGEISHVFDDLQIPVRWSNPDSYNLYLLSLGHSMPFFRLYWLKHKLKNFHVRPFKIVFNNSKIGLSKRYKELIYLDLKEGGEEMRDLLYELRKLLGIKDQGNFIPHLVLGRVSEDLSPQAYTNISKDLYRVGKTLGISKIEFYVSGLKLIKHSSEGFSILLELNQNH